MGSSLPVSIRDIKRAAVRIQPFAHRTPVLRSSTLDRLTGAELYFKCENLQRTGAFKFRGATNAVFSLSDEVAARGVVTHSSGNHAAALARAARERGILATVVIPEGANPAKLEAVRREGARVVRCAPTLAAREETAAAVMAETGGTMVHPFNDVRVMAGQGTATLELLEDIPDPDFVVAPVSGGGLLSGTAIAATESRPSVRVIGAEPSGADDAARSLRAGQIVREPEPDTICDGLRAFVGSLPFEVIRERVDAIATVTDEEVIRAMRLLWEVTKLVVEPSGSVPLAAVLERRFDYPAGARIGIILSGGNANLEHLPWSTGRDPG